jgi:hypothetical protein
MIATFVPRASARSRLSLDEFQRESPPAAEPPKADPPKRKRRWYQFSLRTLMIGVTLLAPKRIVAA